MILVSIMLIGAASALHKKYGGKLYATTCAACTAPKQATGEEEPLEQPYRG